MERGYIAHHIKEDPGLEHLVASIQSRKVLGRLLEVLEALGKRLQEYSTLVVLDYEELGGLSDPGQWD